MLRLMMILIILLLAAQRGAAHEAPSGWLGCSCVPSLSRAPTPVLFDGEPSAIAGLVIAVAIDPVDAPLFAGAPAEVGKEAFVARKSPIPVAPTGADLDAPRSIQFVLGDVPILTTADHSLPDSVF